VYFAPPSGATDTNNGELTLGGTDSSKYSGSITYTPKLTSGTFSYYWGIAVSSITYGSTSLGSGSAIVDTGPYSPSLLHMSFRLTFETPRHHAHLHSIYCLQQARVGVGRHDRLDPRPPSLLEHANRDCQLHHRRQGVHPHASPVHHPDRAGFSSRSFQQLQVVLGEHFLLPCVAVRLILTCSTPDQLRRQLRRQLHHRPEVPRELLLCVRHHEQARRLRPSRLSNLSGIYPCRVIRGMNGNVFFVLLNDWGVEEPEVTSA
jgi:hypothetical protein